MREVGRSGYVKDGIGKGKHRSHLRNQLSMAQYAPYPPQQTILRPDPYAVNAQGMQMGNTTGMTQRFTAVTPPAPPPVAQPSVQEYEATTTIRPIATVPVVAAPVAVAVAEPCPPAVCWLRQGARQLSGLM